MHNLDSRMITRGAAALLTLLSVPFLVGHAAAAEYKLGTLQITQPWARATPMGADSGAAYMTVTNTGQTAERLSCVSSDAAAKCQIHEATMEGGVMKMRPVEGGLQVKPGETVTLKPGGYHMMLVGLKAPLQQGKTVMATLQGDNGATVQVEFPIAGIGAAVPGTESGGGGMMMMQGHGPGTNGSQMK
jgi:periplasmic copper chaperone A